MSKKKAGFEETLRGWVVVNPIRLGVCWSGESVECDDLGSPVVHIVRPTVRRSEGQRAVYAEVTIKEVRG